MRVLINSCCLLALFIGHDAFGSSSVSPNEEVQKNFQQLMETNSCPNCNLSGAVLNRVDLSGANLEGANLAGAKLYLADLSGANLKNANLQGTALGGADLADADLQGANLTGAIMEGAYLVGAKMDGSVMTRRSQVEDDEPETGEVVYVDDEKKSKNLPFTNKAFVESSSGPEKTDVAESVDEKNLTPVATEPSTRQIEDTGKESKKSSTQQDEPTQVQEPMPKDSKKLVMLADAVVPEDAAQKKSRVEMNDKPAEINTDEEKVAVEEDPAPVEKAALVEPPPEIDSKDAKEQQAAAAIPVQQDAPGQVLADQNIQEEPPTPSESLPAELASDSDTQEKVDIQEKPAVIPESVQEESAPVPEPQDLVITDENVEVQPEEAPEQEMSGSMMNRETEPGVILDEDTVVAEMVPVKEAVSDSAEVTAAPETPPESPVQEESVIVVEKFEQVSLENDSPSPVQEEILQLEQEAQATAVEAGSEEPPVQDLEITGDDVVPGTAERDKELLVEMLLDDNRCVGCDLSGVDLSGRNLDEADLERANLRGANLSDADLSEANLKGVDLREANLRDADLREADLYRANLSGADLTGAKFEEALMDMVYSTGAIGADFEGALSD